MSWHRFCQYSKDMAKQVEDEFVRVGYTGTEAHAICRRVSQTWTLPVHGKGGADSGTQGNYNTAALRWKTLLIQYAKANPKGVKKKQVGKKQSHAQKVLTDKKKAANKLAKADQKHRRFHDQNPRRHCGNKNCPFNPT